MEGATFNISMPKSFYAKDYEWPQRQPIFATSDKPIVHIRNETLDEREKWHNGGKFWNSPSLPGWWSQLQPH